MRVIFATDASANHGNSEKAMNSSRSANHTQKPYREMFVTSTREVLAPGRCDFISTLLDNLSDLGQLVRSSAPSRIWPHRRETQRGCACAILPERKRRSDTD